MIAPKICEAHDADRSRCAKDATKTIHWPGRSLVMCDEHAAAAKRVADAMGFDLTIAALVFSLFALVGCGSDAFYSLAPLLEGGTEEAHVEPEPDASKADAEPDANTVDASQGTDATPGKDANAADSGACPMPSPTIGGACSPIGLRACRTNTIAWYCSGTWTSDTCTAQNPSCSPCDAGSCCTIGPVCP